jgi:23S rRNA-/tRNA-specific pseudouridylate synthase
MAGRSGSGKFADLSISNPTVVYELDDEISGVLIVAKEKTSAAKLRNSFGSQALRFTFEFLTFSSAVAKNKPVVCDLPIGQHWSDSRMVISTKTGKKSRTEFVFTENIGDFELWTANCTFLRHHQIRLHAEECGLTIVGENLYSAAKGMGIAKKFAKGIQAGSHWSEKYFPLHLVSVECEDFPKICAPPPKKFQSLVKLLRKYGCFG